MRAEMTKIETRLLGVFAIAIAIASARDGDSLPPPLVLQWNTNQRDGCFLSADKCLQPLGPDGPWQGVLIKCSLFDIREGVDIPGFPSLGYGVTLPDATIGGIYNRKRAKEADSKMLSSDDVQQNDDIVHQKLQADVYSDIIGIQFQPKLAEFPLSVYDVTTWKIDLPNNSTYNYSNAGFLGLDDYNKSAEVSIGPLSYLQKNEKLAERSFSLHLGSVNLRLPGSMVLGGYDQNRIIGSFGAWTSGGPGSTRQRMFLVDVFLDVEQGASPFSKLTQKSIWDNQLGGNKAGIAKAKSAGGVAGSAIVNVDATVPYIYLPPGVCEAIAAHIPVTWRKDIGYYVWNVEEASYRQVISSPAYMGFVLSTGNAENLTIKVPFALLNLTLESPIVETPILYFPCQPVDAKGGEWVLGRAFLQAALWRFDFRTNREYLAQAPGPDLVHSVVLPFPNKNESQQINRDDYFAKSWASQWKVLADSDVEHHGKALGTGEIAGIVLGIIALLGVALLIFFILRRRGRRSARQKQNGKNDETRTELDAQSAAEKNQDRHAPVEAPAESIQEVAGSPIAHEMPTNGIAYELPTDEVVRK